MAKQRKDFDDLTGSLFDAVEMDASGKSLRTDLILVGRSSKPLTKEQKTFNRLTRDIERARADLENVKIRMEDLLETFQAQIQPKQKALATKQLELATLLGTSAKSVKFGKRQKEQLQETILELCDRAFEVIEPDEEAIALHDAWAPLSYEDEIAESSAAFKEHFADLFRQAYGVDLDMEFDQTPEGFARFGQQVQEEFARVMEEDEERKRQRPKSKKAMEREIARQQLEILKRKSLRSVYLSLAKALHPDTTTDSEDIQRKEALMKRVTSAYQKGDLPELLQLEFEWVVAERGHLESLPDDIVKGYNAALKEQLKDLRDEIDGIRQHPRFAEVVGLSSMTDHQARNALAGRMDALDELIDTVQVHLDVCSVPNPKRAIMEVVGFYMRDLEISQEMESFMAYLGSFAR